MRGPLLYDVTSAFMYLGGDGQTFLAAYWEAGTIPDAELRAALPVLLRFRFAVQADYFAKRIVTGDLTGIADAAENERGSKTPGWACTARPQPPAKRHAGGAFGVAGSLAVATVAYAARADSQSTSSGTTHARQHAEHRRGRAGGPRTGGRRGRERRRGSCRSGGRCRSHRGLAGMNDALWYLARGTGVTSLVLLTVVVAAGIANRPGRPAFGPPRSGVALVHRGAALLAVGFVHALGTGSDAGWRRSCTVAAPAVTPTARLICSAMTVFAADVTAHLHGAEAGPEGARR